MTYFYYVKMIYSSMVVAKDDLTPHWQVMNISKSAHIDNLHQGVLKELAEDTSDSLMFIFNSFQILGKNPEDSKSVNIANIKYKWEDFSISWLVWYLSWAK